MVDTNEPDGLRLQKDLNYLSPDILETTNRIFEDIGHIIEGNKNSSNINKYTIGAFYFNKRLRTFHSQLIASDEFWDRRETWNENGQTEIRAPCIKEIKKLFSKIIIDQLPRAPSKVQPLTPSQWVETLKNISTISLDVNDFTPFSTAAADSFECKKNVVKVSKKAATRLLDKFSKQPGDLYTDFQFRNDELLGGLLYSFLKGKMNGPLKEGAFALASVDMDFTADGAPTLMTPWLWNGTQPSSSHIEEAKEEVFRGKQLRHSDPQTELQSKVWMPIQQYLYHKHLFFGKNKGENAIVLPIFDVWDAGHGYGGLWGAVVCTPHAINQETAPQDRDAFIKSPETLTLLLEMERIADVYFASGLTKIAKDPIKAPYDWVELFVQRLHWIQDWERVTVYDQNKVKYSYHHQPGRGWEKCNEGGACCPQVGKEMPDKTTSKRVFRWSDLQVLETKNSILNDRLIKGLLAEESAKFGQIGIEFEFPDSAVVPVEKAIRRRFNLELARQHIAALQVLLPIVRTRRAALRSAVSAIMGRNMSHNIGSHVLARYASKIKDDLVPTPSDKADHRGDFLAYLQRRMDFLAEVATSDQAFWSQPLSLKEQVARLNYGEQQRRIKDSDPCPTEPTCSHHLSSHSAGWISGTPILLSFITGKGTLLASVEYGEPELCKKEGTAPDSCRSRYLPKFLDDYWFACPGGEVGVHALFVILENIIRNSARHDSSEGGSGEDAIRLFVHAIDEVDSPDHLKVEIISPQTRITEATNKDLVDRLNQIIRFESSPFMDTDGKPNPKNWGMREIQICANYLRQNALQDMEGFPDQAHPVLEAGVHELPGGDSKTKPLCLKYTLYLKRAKLMAALVTEDQATDSAILQGEDLPGALRRRGLALIRTAQITVPDVEWERVAKEASGFGFLLVQDDISVQVDTGLRAQLPVRTLHHSNCIGVLKNALGSKDILWMGQLHQCWAEQYRIKRTAWEDRSLYGVVVQGGLLKGDVDTFPLNKESRFFRVTKGSQGSEILPLPQEAKDWFIHLAPSATEKYLAAAWVDHPFPVNFTNTGAMLGTSFRMHRYPKFWACAEGVFSDSPHAEYLNSRPDGGWEILAASLPRIAVLDERVQSSHKDVQREIHLSTLWAAMGVWVPTLDDCNLDKPELDKCKAFLKKPEILFTDTRTEPTKIQVREEQLPIDYLILHLTVLESLHREKLRSAKGGSLAETLLDLVSGTWAEKAEKIIVTGRGVPTIVNALGSDHIEHIRYLPISSLLEYLVTRPSKLALMRALWSASRPL